MMGAAIKIYDHYSGALFSWIIADILGDVLLFFIYKFKQVLNGHMEYFRNRHSQFKGGIISAVFKMNDRFSSCTDKLRKFALLITCLLTIFFDFSYEHYFKPPLYPYSRIG